MDEFVCYRLSMGVAQDKAAMFFSKPLKDKAPDQVRERFDEIMSESREGTPPSQQRITRHDRGRIALHSDVH
jgi:hypothetical protein